MMYREIRSYANSIWDDNNNNTEHPPVREKMSKRLGGIIGCKYKTSSWYFNVFPDGSNMGSTV